LGFSSGLDVINSSTAASPARCTQLFMKLVVISIFLCLSYKGITQTNKSCETDYLFHNIQEKYLCKITAAYENNTSKIHYYFQIGSVKAGLYYSG
jgi:hypothetical protein